MPLDGYSGEGPLRCEPHEIARCQNGMWAVVTNAAFIDVMRPGFFDDVKPLGLADGDRMGVIAGNGGPDPVQATLAFRSGPIGSVESMWSRAMTDNRLLLCRDGREILCGRDGQELPNG